MRLLQFIPPRLRSDEWNRDTDAAELAVPAYMRRDARERALEWTAAVPMTPGFRHVRLPGSAKFAVVPVIRDDQGVLLYGDIPEIHWRPVVGSGLEWGSARIQEPS